MIKKFGAITVALIITIASSMSVFAGNTDNIGSIPMRTITSPTDSVTSGSALEKSSNTTGSALSEVEKSSRQSKAAFDAALKDALRNGKAEDNGEFILKITSPEKNKESTYHKTYALSGESMHDYNDLVIAIAKYNEKSGEYETMVNTDGESTWNCYSAFSKEISLSQGANKIKIVTYRKSQMDDPKFQVNCFTIELLNESIADKVVKKSIEFGENIGDGLKNIMGLLGGGKTGK